MGRTSIFVIAILLAALLSYGAAAQELSGKTADGCSYKVINGQYLTSCPTRKSSDAGNAYVSAAPAKPAAAVTSYDDVPLRRNSAAAAPSLPPQQPVAAPPQQYASALERSEATVPAFDDGDDLRRTRMRNKLIDQTYVGVNVGASNMKEANSSSTAGLGLNLGTNIDETFGVEIGYSYAKQKLNLGLASRGTFVDQDAPATTSTLAPTQQTNDSSLATHLFTGEIQAHLTDPLKRLRPYAGLGLGWRTATLSEERSSSLYGANAAGGSLRQSALGGLFSAGTKLRVMKQLNLGFAFRYFFPFSRADARVEQPVGAANGGSFGQSAPETKLTKSDDTLTGSSQYQILGGLQYSF